MGCLYKDIIREREKPCPFSLILKERDKCRMVQLVEMNEEAEGQRRIKHIRADLDFSKKTCVCWIFGASY